LKPKPKRTLRGDERSRGRDGKPALICDATKTIAEPQNYFQVGIFTFCFCTNPINHPTTIYATVARRIVQLDYSVDASKAYSP
jgi:hypothetical protein